MITMLNVEDAKSPTIMEMAREIKRECIGIEYSECSGLCECFDENRGCLLYGNDPSDWEIGRME